MLRTAVEPEKPYETHDAAMLAAYPPDELAEYVHPDTLRLDYVSEADYDGPYDWWCEAQTLICRFMRQASDRDQPILLCGQRSQ